MNSDLDEEWESFLNDEPPTIQDNNSDEVYKNLDGKEIPKASDIYISTKTKIAYLNQKIDLETLFWSLNIIPYNTVNEGIIKKQMKFISHSEEDLQKLRKNLKSDEFNDELILTRLDNPEGRIKYKDVRKISIGICKKDILSYRCKKKSAFYNCFVVILRVSHECAFHEVHVKVFNTGKMEIPGIKSDALLTKVLALLVKLCSPFVTEKLSWNPEIHTVLINSNFNCGFYINRAKLYSLIQYKYKLSSVYDPCSYPGIQCKFHYDITLEDSEEQTGVLESSKKDNFIKVSFMIFRTGSVLIVGKCDEDQLMNIYKYLKNMLTTEYFAIYEENTNGEDSKIIKPKKVRKKTITVAC